MGSKPFPNRKRFGATGASVGLDRTREDQPAGASAPQGDSLGRRSAEEEEMAASVLDTLGMLDEGDQEGPE